jgi:hypothetical protein
MILTVAGFSGQPDPGANAIYGNLTYAADLAFYRSQIVAIVPEPSSLAILAAAVAGLGGMRWRQRSSATRGRFETH